MVGSMVQCSSPSNRSEQMRSFSVCLLFSLLTGCARTEPSGVVQASKVTEATEANLKPLIGKRITLQGTYSLDKAGDVIQSPKVSLLFEMPATPDIPLDAPIEVTGTLQASLSTGYPYILDKAELKRLPIPGEPSAR
jgi:hypothetical protein